MNSLERMLAALDRRDSQGGAVTPHWWGLYRFQHVGMINGYENEGEAWATSYDRLAEIDAAFYETFKPDMFHLTTAPSVLPIDQKKQEAIMDFRKRDDLLESYAAIDAYIDLLWADAEVVCKSKEFEHVRLCAQTYGDEAFIALNEGSDTACFFDTHVGFEQGLIGLLEKPDAVQYFLSKLYARTLERMKALKEMGAHGFINSETYCSADIMSPTMYREVILPVQKKFYHELTKMGLYPIVYFTGDINPIIEDIKTLDVCGLMIEASKKTFHLDVGEIVRKLEKKIALFGNLDSHACLQLGTVDQVRRETLSQLQKTAGYPFIMSNDCPISFNTPKENIHAMIETVRNYST